MTIKSWKIATAATLLLLVAACQTTGPDPNRAIAPTAAAPAAGALVAEAPNFPPVGAKWTHSVGGAQWTSERLPDGDYEGRTVVRIAGRDNNISVFDVASGNWIATMAANGTKLFSADPDSGTFNWPMFAGKAWTAVATRQDHVERRAWVGRTTYWKVEAEEEVTVPAGTFKTLRMQSSPGNGDGWIFTQWYAPENGMTVKRHHQRTANHYLGGSEREERVLVSVELPPQ